MRRKKLNVVVDPIVPFKYSPKVTLYPGDLFRCSGGPYYVTQDGKKIVMGERGMFQFVNSNGDGITAIPYRPRKELPSGTVFLYMGETKVSETTGTYLRPHKIRKVRKKKGDT